MKRENNSTRWLVEFHYSCKRVCSISIFKAHIQFGIRTENESVRAAKEHSDDDTDDTDRASSHRQRVGRGAQMQARRSPSQKPDRAKPDRAKPDRTKPDRATADRATEEGAALDEPPAKATILVIWEIEDFFKSDISSHILFKNVVFCGKA